MKIKTKYQEYKAKKGKLFTEPSRAIQSARDSTFIESYLRKYRITGILGDPARRGLARYGDFASLPDFQEMQNRVAYTTQFFESLPSSLRRDFGDNVENFVRFVSDPANRDKAVELGILTQEFDNGVSAQSEEPQTDIQTSAVAESKQSSPEAS